MGEEVGSLVPAGGCRGRDHEARGPVGTGPTAMTARNRTLRAGHCRQPRPDARPHAHQRPASRAATCTRRQHPRRRRPRRADNLAGASAVYFSVGTR